MNNCVIAVMMTLFDIIIEADADQLYRAGGRGGQVCTF